MSTAYFLRCCKHNIDSMDFNRNKDGVKWAWEKRFEIINAYKIFNSDPYYINLVEINHTDFVKFLEEHKFCEPVTLKDEYEREIELLTKG